MALTAEQIQKNYDKHLKIIIFYYKKLNINFFSSDWARKNRQGFHTYCMQIWYVH